MKRLFLLALVLVTFVAGCSQAGRPAGSFTIAQQWEPRSLNPALENGTSSSEWSAARVLLSREIRRPRAARSPTSRPTFRRWPTAASAPTARRSPITFARGFALPTASPLTAADCAWSIDAINNPANNVQSRFAYDDVARADAPDPTTLVLHLKRPFPPLTSSSTRRKAFRFFRNTRWRSSRISITPLSTRAPFGSGPYDVTRWSRGDRVELEANPYYWQGTVPASRT